MIRITENSREQAQIKLKHFIKNPGFFSILVLGDSGTGKNYLIKNILREFDSTKIGYYYPFEIGDDKDAISKIFMNDFVIIRNVEELSDAQQQILTVALSTIDGRIGIEPNRDYKRIIFTSSFAVDALREGSDSLINRFWDRISQLVVEIPSFRDFSAEIKNDFKSVWHQMDFKVFSKLPEDDEFQGWLTENCKAFSGNFRDLDKIAILWHQHRIIQYENSTQKFKSDVEARIFRKVREDFESFTHFPTQKADTTNVFEFTKGKTWDQIERSFKAKFKNWAKNEYDSIKDATKELDMPLRKMDKW